MARITLCGPSYTSQSVIADSEQTINWYCESIESTVGETSFAMYPCPGKTLFCTLPKGQVRGIFEINGRVFAVGGNTLYEVSAKGVVTAWGSVGDDFLPVSFATNGTAGNQLVICSAQSLYVFFLAAQGNNAAGTLIGPIGGLQGQASQIVFCQGYFVCQLTNTNKFQVSALEDATTWNALSVQQVQVFPENIGRMLVFSTVLFVMGVNGHAQVYYNSGANQYTPFDVIQGAFMEEGIGAPYSLCELDNTPFWLGIGRNGGAIGWRANGYSPVRVSNHAIEWAWSKYPSKGTDAIGFSYRDQGHSFWVLRFPSANNGFGATWVYDAATQMWHERGSWTGTGGFNGFTADRAGFHSYGFNQFLVGDWGNGNIYSMSVTTPTENGGNIRRLRRTPPISSENDWVFHQELVLNIEAGLGPEPPFQGANGPIGPQIMVRWSDDGGKTWSNEHWIDCGPVGAYKTRVQLNRLGRSRDRVYEIIADDPVLWRIIDGYLTATPGFQKPVERYNKQMAKMA